MVCWIRSGSVQLLTVARGKHEKAMTTDLPRIVGEKLSAVVFVVDYWQLQFDGPLISALTRIEVNADGEQLRDGDDQFRNAICAQIGKVVIDVTMTRSEAFTITFKDGSEISISLKLDDYRGPEAMILFGTNGNPSVVIRADS